MSKLRRSAALVLCYILLSGCTVARSADDKPGLRNQAYQYTQIDRFGYLVANAFRTTHPEYAITLGDYAALRSADEMAIQVDIGPNWYSSLTPSMAALDIRQDKTSGRVYYSLPYDRTPLPSENAAPGLDPQPREAAALTAAVHRIGTGSAPEKDDVDEVLKRAGQANTVTAVVELKKPLTADEIRHKGYLSFSNAIFSPAGESPPIYWDLRATWFCQNCGGDSRLVTSDFRAWVNSLQPQDDPLLRQFGLSLDRLKNVASTGYIYGFIEADANPLLLRQLLKKRHVKTIHIVDVRKYCKDFDLSDCVPALWTKHDQLSRG